MSRMMVRLGCNVETAENGKIALDMLLHEGEEMQATQARKSYDITFLDNQVSGWAFLSSWSDTEKALGSFSDAGGVRA